MDKSKNKVSVRAPRHSPTSVRLSVAERASSVSEPASIYTVRPGYSHGPAAFCEADGPTNIAGVGAARRAQRARAVGVVHLPPPAALPGLAERTPTAALRSAIIALRLHDGAAAALTLGNPTLPGPALRRYLYFSDAGFVPRVAWADAPLELLFGKLVVPADAAVVTWDSIPLFYRCAA